MSTNYTDSFYQALKEGAARSAAAIVPLVLDQTGARSVVDVGCGSGEWLRGFRACGVGDSLGIEGEWAAGELAEFRFLAADLSNPLTVDRQFDLATCLEVGEHLPAHSASTLVASLTRLAPIVMFSAAIPHQGGVDHLNEQWPEYWAALFRAHGYRPIDSIRPAVWTRNDVEWWYAQNTLLFATDDAIAARSALRPFADRTDAERLSVVHPRHYLGKITSMDLPYYRPDPDRFPLSTLISVAPRVVANAVRNRLGLGAPRGRSLPLDVKADD